MKDFVIAMVNYCRLINSRYQVSTKLISSRTNDAEVSCTNKCLEKFLCCFSFCKIKGINRKCFHINFLKYFERNLWTAVLNSVKHLKSLTIFAKYSILDVWQDSKYASVVGISHQLDRLPTSRLRILLMSADKCIKPAIIETLFHKSIPANVELTSILNNQNDISRFEKSRRHNKTKIWKGKKTFLNTLLIKLGFYQAKSR